MAKISIPQGLPKSKIIDELTLKSENKIDSTINALSLLDDFRKRVSDEVRQINELFPEYTPHDEGYHLSRLFSIADMVLGNVLIENLNFSELLILSLALYGHDWGMAVSEIEKELIISNKIRKGFNKADYALLPDENKKFNDFLKENNSPDGQKLQHHIWQEYVRRTHAFRSGERIRKYFERINSGIGEATCRVCEAHWLDFKYLEDNTTYPTNFAILNESINLKAVGIYLRLIDLLDISEDRTPYIIWNFVAPKNIRSKMEWDKHRCIHSITSSPYQDGRIIQIEGSSKDNEVYASLVDLQYYCDEQLKGCNDLLSQVNISRYNLNLFSINWRIRAIGFKPISIQFEFDRKRMFEILSDEIYQGDKYVFLRELLQNSIDAIKLRKEVLEKKGGMKTSLSEFGLIEINVKHLNDGDAEITISDNGIGMNEYVLKNYLSIAGKSYYTSDDFLSLGLDMDPISKFGVGVLSCFMVADRIDIETFRERYLSSDSEKLKIQIPSVTQQFRVEVSNDTDSTPGSLFKIYVLGSKLRDNYKGTSVQKLNVTEYVSKIAGFVPIPLKISENGVDTLIIGPYENDAKIIKRFKGVAMRKIQLRYPVEKVFEPQHIDLVNRLFKEKIIDIKSDLKLNGINGKIISLEPIDENALITSTGIWPATEFIINHERIKFKEEWVEYGRAKRNNKQEKEFGKSATTSAQYQVYLDGILVSNVSEPSLFEDSTKYSDDNELTEFYLNKSYLDYSFDNVFCLPFIVVNFSKKNFKPIDLSRTELVGKKEKWEAVLWQKYTSFVKEEFLQKLLLAKPIQRALILAQLAIFKRVGLLTFKDLIPVEKFVVPIIEKKGILKFKEWKYYLNRKIYLQPESFDHFDKELAFAVEKKKKVKSKLDNWKSEEFIYSGIRERDGDESSQLLIISKLAREVLHKTHVLNSIRFLNSPWKKSPPLLQKVYMPCAKVVFETEKGNEVLRKAIEKISELTVNELSILNSLIKKYFRQNYLFKEPVFCVFEKPCNKYFAFSFEYLNFTHHTTMWLIQIFCKILLNENDTKIDKVVFGRLIDCFMELPFFSYGTISNKVTFNFINITFNKILDLVKALGWNELNSTPAKVDKNSFIENSIFQKNGKIYSYDRYVFKTVNSDLRSYSRPYLPT